MKTIRMSYLSSLIWKRLTYTFWLKLFLLVYIAFPLIIKTFPSIILNMVYSHHLRSLILNQLNRPKEAWGIFGGTNYFLPSSSGNRIGTWHIPPSSSEEPLKNAKNVMIYCHGKRGHRGSGHRIPFYEILQKLNFHVVAFDYSGFGDSTGSPDGKTTVEDTISVYRWTVNQISKDAVIMVWGHSLGSAICTKALHTISKTPIRQPDGFVLEAPFTNLLDAVQTHPLAKTLFLSYPYLMTYLFKDICKTYDMAFQTDLYLPEIKCHVLMLHSDDDPKIMVKFSERLYSSISNNPTTKVRSLQLVRFDAKYNLGHSNIYQSLFLPEIIQKFHSEVAKSFQTQFFKRKYIV